MQKMAVEAVERFSDVSRFETQCAQVDGDTPRVKGEHRGAINGR
ncbi:hypothetical protein PC119_g20015 [Phytophthora cactorum]|nr:hypothetical protein PC119_g20015 [Phytophthora cactorum]